MAQQMVFSWTCDFCGTESSGSEKKVRENLVRYNSDDLTSVDACDACWAPYEEMFTKIREAGRPQKTAVRDIERQRAKARARLAG